MLALAVCGVAVAQTAPAKPAAPATPPAAKYTTKLPEVPAGQWGDGILKDAKTQEFDGKAYAAVEFERLQAHVDAICHFDKAADIIGKPVATIATYRQNMGWPALVDGRQVDIFRTPHEDGKMILPYILVDVTGIVTDLREDIYFKACGGLNFKVCTVALYGRFEWREAKDDPGCRRGSRRVGSQVHLRAGALSQDGHRRLWRRDRAGLVRCVLQGRDDAGETGALRHFR